jgi:hypothetical protein
MMSTERELLVHALDRLKHINYEDDHLTNDLIQTIQKHLNQPARKPLSDEEIDIGFQTDTGNYIDETSFIAGVRFAEKIHGITGGGE